MNESQDDGPPVYGVVGAVTSSSWGADVYSALLRAGPVQKQKGRIEVGVSQKRYTQEEFL